ncbi:MAG TPA: tetratricopeptide repeat protein [Desulfatiglandales bacterium]|nr:tetratricopeptide repeat protein [Desulfatiglandales bacterium]
MIKNTVKISFVSFIFLVSTSLFNPNASCQQPTSLQEGIDQYKAGKYEEAINTLEKVQAEGPKSSVAAFFLGLAYKQTMDYEKALNPLRDAVTLTPRIKEALIELIDVEMQLGEIEEAKKWVGVAEEENVLPAKTAFLKGLILREEGKNEEAAAAFEKAKSIDPTIAQASDIQIALGYMTDRKLKKAKENFQAAITQDPQSDMAGFARQYLAVVEQRIVLERPFSFAVGIFGQYDDNMILKPTEEALASDVTNEASRVLNSSFRANYAPSFDSQWLLNAQYTLMSSLHQKNIHTHDSLSNSLSITPGYNFGKYALNLSTRYTHTLVRGPSYKRYSGAFSSGPLLRIAIKDKQLLEFFGGYTNTGYSKPALAIEEERDSEGYNEYISWIWLFSNDSFLNLKYQFRYQDADGQNWDNISNEFSANLMAPLVDKIKFQISGQMTGQDFRNTHSTFKVKRSDTTYYLSGGLTWDCYKDTIIVAQYSRTRTNSNIGAYDYTRNTYTIGMEYRF